MAEQSTQAAQSGCDLDGDTTVSSTNHPLGIPIEELKRRRHQYIKDALRQAGSTARADRVTGEDLLAAYDRLAARYAAERNQG